MKQPDNLENAKASRDPGAELARARAARQLGVDEAARQLKLPRATVEDIEAGRFDRIAAIYRRGYIVNYARLVGLDPQPLLDGMGEFEPEPLRTVLPVEARGQRFDRFLKFATYALVTTVIVPPLVYFFIGGGARLFESGVASRSDAERPVAESADGDYRERVADAMAVRSPDTESDARTPLSASALPVSIRAESVNRPDHEAAVDEPAAADGSDPTKAAAESRLELVLTDDSWVEIEAADGMRLEFDLLLTGQTRTYTGQPPFRLLLGRGSAVTVSLNGEPVTFDGEDQAGVAELVLGDPVVVAAPGESGSGSAAE